MGWGTIWLETVPVLTNVDASQAVVGCLDNVSLLIANAG